MSSIVIAGDTSGTCTLQAANVAGNTVLNLPTTSGTLVSSGSIPAAGSTTQVQYNNAGSFAGSSNFVFDGTNVGIGTSSPTAPLTVVTPLGGLALQINGRSSDNLGGLYFYANNGTTSYSQITASATEYRVASQSTAVQTFYTNGTERMRIDSSGNVGIGTSSPDAKLKVVASGANLLIGFSGNANYYDAATHTFRNFAGTNYANIDSSGNFQFNSGYGSVATAYGCRAWVNYNAVSASIRGSGNVSSVTNNGAGDNTINFTNAMPDVNYSWSIMQQLNGTGNNDVGASGTARNQGTNAWGTSFLRILTMSHSNTTQENPLVLTVAVFR